MLFHMKKMIILLVAMVVVMPSCRNNNPGEAMPITVNLRYTGADMPETDNQFIRK